MLVRRTVEQSSELFHEREHLLCFEGGEEMRAATRTLLENYEAAKSMADNAKRKVFAEHLLSFRIDRILEDLS